MKKILFCGFSFAAVLQLNLWAKKSLHAYLKSTVILLSQPFNSVGFALVFVALNMFLLTDDYSIRVLVTYGYCISMPCTEHGSFCFIDIQKESTDFLLTTHCKINLLDTDGHSTGFCDTANRSISLKDSEGQKFASKTLTIVELARSTMTDSSFASKARRM